MEKQCVFCGAKPQSKTNEHILPQWLLELTGDPKRVVSLGPHPIKGIPSRKFSFNQFKFPSCEDCNERFGSLEEKSKLIIFKMLAEETISKKEFNILFDWFDKVRIGLWLAFYYLNKNPFGIEPNFHIETRLGMQDRMLAIFRANSDRKGLTFLGCNLPVFYYIPSCFSLVINDLYFLNISYPFLLARRLGLPFPGKATSNSERGMVQYDMQHGKYRVMLPLLKKVFVTKGTELYQPMFSNILKEGKAPSFYDNEYVRDHTMDWSKGVGEIYIQTNDGIKKYPSSPTYEWLPPRKYSLDEIRKRIMIETLDWQIYILNLCPSLEEMSLDQKRLIMKANSKSIKINRMIIERLRRENG